MALVGFCGSRDSLPAFASALVTGVVSSVLRSPRSLAVGCSVGVDAAVLSAALAASAAPRVSVFAAFGPVSPPWPAPLVEAPGASSSLSSVSGVASALADGASVSWWSGSGPAVPLAGRLASRSAALVSAVAASRSSGPGAGLVGFVSGRCPASVAPSPSPSACFPGASSGSWSSLALAAGLGLPVIVFPFTAASAPASWLPDSWGSWAPLSGAWSGGFRLVPAAAPLFDP